MVSEWTDFNKLVELLYAQYKERGYITENQILDCGGSFDVVSKLTERLLDLGVIIQDEPTNITNDTEEDNYDASRTDYDRIFNHVLTECPELESFIKYVRQIKAPQFKEWQTLVPQAKNGNHWAEDRLFEMYLRVVVKTAWHYHRKYNIDLCDAIQEGATGLLSAIEKFDISEYNAFTTFIARPIANFITRNCDLPNYVLFDIPTYYKDNLFKIYDIVENHQCPECMCKPRKNECETLKDEIVAKLSCSLEEAKEYLNIFTEHEHEIFDLPNENQVSAFDVYSQKQLEKVVRTILMELSPKEQFVLSERYISEDQKTLEDVGSLIGVTRERVRQIEMQALNKLKHPTRARMLRSFLSDDVLSAQNKRILEEHTKLQTNNEEQEIKVAKPRIKWTPYDIKKLKDYINKGYTAGDIAKKFDVTEENVINRIIKIGWQNKLKMSAPETTPSWNVTRIKQLKKYIDKGFSVSEIAIKMKTTKGTISGKVSRLGWGQWLKKK